MCELFSFEPNAPVHRKRRWLPISPLLYLSHSLSPNLHKQYKWSTWLVDTMMCAIAIVEERSVRQIKLPKHSVIMGTEIVLVNMYNYFVRYGKCCICA